MAAGAAAAALCDQGTLTVAAALSGAGNGLNDLIRRGTRSVGMGPLSEARKVVGLGRAEYHVENEVFLDEVLEFGAVDQDGAIA